MAGTVHRLKSTALIWAVLPTLSIAGGAGIASNTAAAGPVSLSAGADVVSAYWFRGATLTDRLTLQPSATVGWSRTGLALTVLGSAAVTDRDRLRFADEVDLILGWDLPVSLGRHDGTLSASCAEYFYTAYSGPSAHTEEAMIGFTLDGRLVPSLTAYYDFGLGDELYLEAGLAPEFALDGDDGPRLGLQLILGAGRLGEPFGLRDVEAAGSLSFPLGSISLAPGLGYAYVPSGPFEGDGRFIGRISVSFGE